ncbi:dTDP-glucose 4,6-dehydratase [Candidatus Gottesmanbacteria bacterium CG11_big_fil_rev_8_21_14_0_20_37_11]|uniref:dTDP-glucose 4,6-dehydratase n=3 Tax=Candidatus Gottesmaniibacteriota TaxID=1752720 RepID=A0A2M7RQ62_9BACT|nr:MAG: dTDP-glucose 4,6-dehydratase [Candidatus Gottesmanbacteria bacterium CG1_02_37_22]PIP32765.1 MAG: dTDP-glucose 4,6-dehydratase [Candidatus Gottesmanbacteria bacterium CG23_combo_of_CG06-09_8_20_14_all_37_19]PIR08223.1 MAG: dTDP-glucose 4,6-dehydratase [Candidatus Gottesmanbacteria bacterium CG11_big_fil_rev_8_21_14_0_20_37_11]PIZ02471.1 MAG: dTDP-glucose 4,6-dehydratase [Candidatus Gottesmanbacteria bacterium CG_4_10_14_0_8_um_filter_37_24]
MKLLITGGAGFIGSNFILYWFRNYPKDKIINLDKLTYAGNLENLTTISSFPNYSFVKGDICDAKLVDSVMDGIDIVVHFAAESHVDRSISSPSEFVSTNVVGTHILLEASVRHKIKRFHHISTDEVFGSLDLNSKDKFNEETPYNPNSPYSASKAASDHLVRAYFQTYGLPASITNCSNNYGPYQYPEKLIPLTITNILEEKKVPVYGDGQNIRDWLYVEDHCAAIDRVLTMGKPGRTYCVGGCNTEITNLDVVMKILEILGKDKTWVKFVKDRPGHDRKYAVNYKKIQNELGWKPLHNFDAWVYSTVEWYRRNSKWWKKLKQGDYLKYYQNQYQGI